MQLETADRDRPRNFPPCFHHPLTHPTCTRNARTVLQRGGEGEEEEEEVVVVVEEEEFCNRYKNDLKRHAHTPWG